MQIWRPKTSIQQDIMAEEHLINNPEKGVQIIAQTIISRPKLIEIFDNRLADLIKGAIDILKSHAKHQQIFARYDHKSWKAFNADAMNAVVTLHMISDLMKMTPEMKSNNFDKYYYIEFLIGNDLIAVWVEKNGFLALSTVDHLIYERL